MKKAGVHGKLSLIKKGILRDNLVTTENYETDEQQGTNDPNFEEEEDDGRMLTVPEH